MCSVCMSAAMKTLIYFGLANALMKTNALRRRPAPTLEDLIDLCMAEEVDLSATDRLCPNRPPSTSTAVI